MGNLLWKDGNLVFSGGNLVWSSDPKNCKCCGSPPSMCFDCAEVPAVIKVTVAGMLGPDSCCPTLWNSIFSLPLITDVTPLPWGADAPKQYIGHNPVNGCTWYLEFPFEGCDTDFDNTWTGYLIATIQAAGILLVGYGFYTGVPGTPTGYFWNQNYSFSLTTPDCSVLAPTVGTFVNQQSFLYVPPFPPFPCNLGGAGASLTAQAP
jgi:hypothetical protein